MKCQALLTLTLLFSAASTVVSGDADNDQKALQGVWRAEEGPATIVLKIEGNNWEFKIKDKEELFLKGTFTLDAKASPRAINLLVKEASREMEMHKGRTAVGIYELKGGRLRWCSREPGQNSRPTEFAEDSVGDLMSLEFKRRK